jgi:hypothetical protein
LTNTLRDDDNEDVYYADVLKPSFGNGNDDDLSSIARVDKLDMN